MKILHIYAGNLYGGIETLLVSLERCKGLCPEMVPEFGLCFRSRLWGELEAEGASLHDLGEVRISRPWSVWRARRTLRGILREKRFDVVATHACWPHAVFASEVRAARTPLVHFGHDAITQRSMVDRLASRNSPDLVIANSIYTASFSRQLFPKAATSVIHYPINQKRLLDETLERSRLRSELATDPSAVVILQVGRLERWKGAWKLIEALAELKEDETWTAWIVGGVQRSSEIDYFNELRSAATRYGIDGRIRFLGSRSDVPRIMASADLFCQANTGPEPFGITFIEAMNAGLPVVASDTGGPDEIVDQSCGIKVKAGDTSALAQALNKLISDANLREKLGANGILRAKSLCDPARQLRSQYEAMRSIWST